MGRPILAFSRHIAHRGASSAAPENTKAAFVLASSLGAHWIECDVRLNGEDAAFIFHDDTLERTAGGSERFIELSTAAVEQLDVGSWFDEKYSGEPVMDLESCLRLMRVLGVGLNLELKLDYAAGDLPAQRFALVNLVVNAVNAIWPELDYPLLLISSSDLEMLALLRARIPTIRTGFVGEAWVDDFADVLQDFCFSWSLDHRCLTRERVKMATRRGLYLLAYTVNDADRQQELLDFGVNSVFTDHVEVWKNDVVDYH